MKPVPFYIFDAFTDTTFQGNPAGVFFDDESVLTAEEMQQMAGEVSLESAFVTSPPPDSDADFALRYFTGVVEVPFCGHDTVSTAVALVYTRRIDPATKPMIRFHTPIGEIAVLLAGGTTATLIQKLPAFGDPADEELIARVASALGCTVTDIISTGLPVQVVSTGTPCLIVPVTDRGVVNAAPASFDAILALSRETSTFTMYVFSIDPSPVGAEIAIAVWSRCFAPFAGLNEDPVTGSASGALGGYLAAHGRLGPPRNGRVDIIVASQGFGGGRGGVAEIAVGRGGDGGITSIAVTGKATLVAEGVFRLRRGE